MRGIMWFREDLRMSDNNALFYAAQKCEDGIIAIYLLDVTMWQAHKMAACRVEFLLRGLKQLSEDLKKKHIPLLVHSIKNMNDAPAALLNLAMQYNIKAVFFNRQYEVNELRRDDAVSHHLTKKGVSCHNYDDQVILPPGTVLTQQGESFKVFTAFKNTWRKVFTEQGGIQILPTPKAQKPLAIQSTAIPLSLREFKSIIDPTRWPAGDTIAKKQLSHFINKHLFLYDKERDFPALNATSQLSPYLSAGMISPRQCFMAAFTENHGHLDYGNKGAVTWMSELIWREFYKHILVAIPRVCMGKAFKPETEKLPWKYDQKQLTAWQEGKTGYPIIDAAMRQLNTTGWMHNRLRMVVGMFLTKNLFIDWRSGEDYFIRHLIDGDLAANNGGWQWCASTGTDAVPYFRIFNPITQSERFDEQGHFIREYCPELAEFDHYSIHDPHGRMPLLAQKANYPAPFVDLKQSRLNAIAAFKKI